MMWGEPKRLGGCLGKALLLSLLLLVCTACGRKAPPVPPRFDGLTPPAGVTATVEGETLTVSWSDPPLTEWRLVTGYRVYLSMVKEGDEPCKGCPVRFEKVGDTGANEERFSFSASPGALYTIEVRATAEGGYLSDPSRRVSVDLRKDATTGE